MLQTSWYLPGANFTLKVFVRPTSYSPDSPTLVALGSSSLNLLSAPIGIPPTGRSVRITSNSWLTVPLLVTVKVSIAENHFVCATTQRLDVSNRQKIETHEVGAPTPRMAGE